MRVYAGDCAGLYFSGDGARRDSDGHYQITGRVDDVINVKGHRIGTAELESCLVCVCVSPCMSPYPSACAHEFLLVVDLLQDHDARVAETAVVGFPHEVYGEGDTALYYPLAHIETCEVVVCSFFVQVSMAL